MTDHLLGKHTIGTYAINQNDTCTFLAADFDKSNWKEDVIAYKDAASELGVDVSLEISRSGNGAHVWIFFSEPVPAKEARQLGSIILSNAASRHISLSLDSYDRFFPNQDYIPNGGFGNLIALPLQKTPRENGKTVFVDESFKPFENQWEYLSGVKLLDMNDTVQIIQTSLDEMPDEIPIYPNDVDVHLAEKILKSNIIDCPEITEPVEITLYNRVFINVSNIPSEIVFALKKIGIFANPEYFKKQRNRFSTWNTPKYICCAEIEDNILSLPRGLQENVISFLSDNEATVKSKDNRPDIPDCEIQFSGKLYPYQKKAVTEIAKHNHAVLVAPTGIGKTIMACSLIATRKKPVLILLHRSELITQWIDKLTSSLENIEKKDIGVLGSGRKKLKGTVDIAMIQTMSKKVELEDVFKQYDFIIIDECHHVPAVSFEAVLNSFSAHYFLGLTATPQRKEGDQAIIYMQCGPIRYEVEDIAATFQNRMVIFRETPINDKIQNSRLAMHQIWEEICDNPERNQLICNDVSKVISEERIPLILSDRKSHIEKLNNCLQNTLSENIDIYTLTGDLGKKARRETIQKIRESINQQKKFCILATGALIGEGFDIPELNTLFLTMPISFKGRLIQFAGRLHRQSEDDKEILIYDYVDSTSGLTISMFKKRIATYKSMSYKLICKSAKLERWIV
ncbi:MAG: DEAD/DEAH box helicase [Spirochaetes bacterium]|nr:DEAD/DEAH box helicase [Spirochaetota bacterium]